MRYERMSQNTQLSRPSERTCGIAFSGTVHVQTARVAVGVSLWRNWTLRQAIFDIWRGEDLPEPPHAYSGVIRLHARKVEPVFITTSDALSLRKAWGLPVSGRAMQQYWVEAVAPL